MTGQYGLDTIGYWESQQEYDAALGLYYTRMVGYVNTVDAYEETITNVIAPKFYYTGEIGKYRDLAWNLIALSSYFVTDTSSGLFEFVPWGDMVVMLDKPYREMNVAISPDGIKSGACSENAVTTMDIGSGQLRSSFSFSAQNEECQQIALDLGYEEYYGDKFEFTLDVRSFSTVVAVNYGIISAGQLTEMKENAGGGYIFNDQANYYNYGYGAESQSSSAYQNYRRLDQDEAVGKFATSNINQRTHGSASNNFDSFQIEELVSEEEIPGDFISFNDVKYPGMKPVACIIFDSDKTKSICFLEYQFSFGSVYVYPVFKHYYGTDCYNESQWGEEWHNLDPLQDTSWTQIYDTTFDLLIGLIVFRNATEAKDFAKEAWGYLSQPDGKGDLVIPDRVYPSLKALYKKNLKRFPEFDLNQVCGNSTVTGETRDCFLWMYDVYGPGYYITQSNYQLFAGSCRNSLFVKESFEGARNLPPQSLIQTYYECTLTPYDSVFNAVGLSLGNADLYSRYFFFIVMGIVVTLMVIFGGFETRLGEYESKEQKMINESNTVVNSVTENELHTTIKLPGGATRRKSQLYIEKESNESFSFSEASTFSPSYASSRHNKNIRDSDDEISHDM